MNTSSYTPQRQMRGDIPDGPSAGEKIGTGILNHHMHRMEVLGEVVAGMDRHTQVGDIAVGRGVADMAEVLQERVWEVLEELTCLLLIASLNIPTLLRISLPNKAQSEVLIQVVDAIRAILSNPAAAAKPIQTA